MRITGCVKFSAPVRGELARLRSAYAINSSLSGELRHRHEIIVLFIEIDIEIFLLRV